MSSELDIWRAIMGMGLPRPVTPPPFGAPGLDDSHGSLYGQDDPKGYTLQDVIDAGKSLRYGEDSLAKPRGNPRDIALPPQRGLATEPQVPAIEQSIMARNEPQYIQPGPDVAGPNFPENMQPAPPEPHGQVNVTIGGKTYDYGKGESIPDSLKGRMGAGSSPVYTATANGDAALMGRRSFGGQGGHGSASMVQLSDDSTTPMADQLREEKLGRTLAQAAQARASMDVADPYGAERARAAGIETEAIGQRGKTGIAQKVEGDRMRADVIAQEERAEHVQIDQDADRNLAMEMDRLRGSDAYQGQSLQGRMAMEQQLREKARAYIEQQKREASVALYARYGISKAPVGIGQDPNAGFPATR